MKRILPLLFFIPLFLHAASFQQGIPVVLEYADTPEERAWGLMGRRALFENQGMLFIYPKEEKIALWMFNCFIDLSVAFLDHEAKILEIRELKSYPEKMDPARPVLSLRDFQKYPANDRVLAFFRSRQIASKSKALFALEMKAGWFDEKGIKAGDRLIWTRGSPFAEIVRVR